MHHRDAAGFGHLAFTPDPVGARRSGPVQMRKQLFSGASAVPGYWDSGKAVILLFGSLGFKQSKDRPILIPLDRQKCARGDGKSKDLQCYVICYPRFRTPSAGLIEWISQTPPR